MDDLPNQPVHGLIHPSGVAFTYTIDGLPSLEAEYNDSGPGTQAFIDDPSIEGSAFGVLTMAFAIPTRLLEFGVATIDSSLLPNDATLVLLDSKNLQIDALDISIPYSQVFDFPETRVSYMGAPVSTAILRFTVPEAAGSFAFDNLSFYVPAPASLFLVLVAAAIGLGRAPRQI